MTVSTSQDIQHRTDGRTEQNSLHAVFSAFSRISDQLTASYQELEHKVGELQTELALTDQARHGEHQARALLAERLDVIVNAIPVAFILLDGQGVVVKANQLARNLLCEEIVDSKWIDIISRCFAPQGADGHELLLKNGRLVSLVTQSLSHEPGQIIVLSDQTETRRLQNQLNHSRKLSDMGRMTASLAHQIRTPLSTAILYADHLASPQLDESRRFKYASKLKQRLQNLEQQVRDMLIFSRAGVVLQDEVSADDLVASVESKVTDLRAQRPGILTFHCDAGQGRLRCNTEMLTSAFSNLIENAFEACLEAGIDPCIRLQVKKNESGLLEVSVEDNGPGFPESYQDQVTEPFFTTKSTGTGLGLAVVRAITEAHGGQFIIQNRIEGGVSARISLPLAQRSVAAVQHH